MPAALAMQVVRAHKQFLEHSAQMARTLPHQVPQELRQWLHSMAVTVATEPTAMPVVLEPTEPTAQQVLQVQLVMPEALVVTAAMVLTVQLVAMVRLVW